MLCNTRCVRQLAWIQISAKTAGSACRVHSRQTRSQILLQCLPIQVPLQHPLVYSRLGNVLLPCFIWLHAFRRELKACYACTQAKYAILFLQIGQENIIGKWNMVLKSFGEHLPSLVLSMCFTALRRDQTVNHVSFGDHFWLVLKTSSRKKGFRADKVRRNWYHSINNSRKLNTRGCVTLVFHTVNLWTIANASSRQRWLQDSPGLAICKNAHMNWMISDNLGPGRVALSWALAAGF